MTEVEAKTTTDDIFYLFRLFLDDLGASATTDRTWEGPEVQGLYTRCRDLVDLTERRVAEALSGI